MANLHIKFSSKSVLIEKGKKNGFLIITFRLQRGKDKIDVSRSFEKFIERCIETFQLTTIETSRETTLLYIGRSVELDDDLPKAISKLNNDMKLISESLLPHEISAIPYSGYHFKGKYDRLVSNLTIKKKSIMVHSYFGKSIYEKVLDLSKITISKIRKETMGAIIREGCTSLRIAMIQGKKSNIRASISIQIQANELATLEMHETKILKIMKDCPEMSGKVKLNSTYDIKYPWRMILGVLDSTGSMATTKNLLSVIPSFFPSEKSVEKPENEVYKTRIPIGEKMVNNRIQNPISDELKEETKIHQIFQKYNWMISRDKRGKIIARCNNLEVEINAPTGI